jgi:hypothetical protein
MQNCVCIYIYIYIYIYIISNMLKKNTQKQKEGSILYTNY